MPSQRDGGSCVSPLADDDAYASLVLALESFSLSTPEKKEVSYAKPYEEDKPIEPKVSIVLLSRCSSTSGPAFPPSSQPSVSISIHTNNYNRWKSTRVFSSRLQLRQPSSSLSLLPSRSLPPPRWLPS